VAGSGRPFSGAAEYGVREGLRGLVAAGTGGGGVVAPRRVCAEVALARPHLGEATRGELVEAHERMGLERGTVGIAGRVGRCFFPFFH